MEAWVHGNAIAFDPGSIERGSGIGSNVDLSGPAATLNVGPPRHRDAQDAVFNFPWPVPSAVGEQAPLTLDEVLLRMRSSNSVGIKRVTVYDREKEFMRTVLDKLLVPDDDFEILRFPAPRPGGYTDFDTRIEGPISVVLEVRALAPSVGGSTDISAAGIRLRRAWLGR